MAKDKTPKTTAREQGFPEAYLGEAGNFKIGMDARAKSDLVNAALGLPADKALHQFSVDEATALLAKRDWTKYLEKKREKIAADASRKASRSAEKKNTAKARAEAKKARGGGDTTASPEGSPEATDEPGDTQEREAKPDPKPERKPRSARGFKRQ